MTKTTAANLANAILGFTVALLAVLVAFGLRLTAEQQAAILGFVGSVLVLASAVIAMRGMDRSRVVEQLTPSGKVLAGEASELPTGARIRDLGDHALQNMTVQLDSPSLPVVDDDDGLPMEPVVGDES